MDRISNLFGTTKASEIIESATQELTSSNVAYVANKLSLYAVIDLESKSKANAKKRSIIEALNKKIKKTTDENMNKLLKNVLSLLVLFTDTIIASFNEGRKFKSIVTPVIDLKSSNSFKELKEFFDNAQNEELKAVASIIIIMLSTGETIKNIYKFREFQNDVKSGFTDDELFNMLNHFKSVFGEVANRSLSERVARRLPHVLGTKYTFTELVKIGQFNVLSTSYKYE